MGNRKTQVRTRAGSPIEAGLAVDQGLGRSPDSRVIGIPVVGECTTGEIEPPSQSSSLQWLRVVRSSAFTVAGQWRTCTAFPWPDRDVICLLLVGSQSESAGDASRFNHGRIV